MSIAIWKPGTVYLPEALVIPTTNEGAAVTDIPNPAFESGDTGWTKGGGWAINASSPFEGTNSAQFSGTAQADLINSTKVDCVPGKSITAQCFVQQGAGAVAQCAVMLVWYDTGGSEISRSVGNAVGDSGTGIWKSSSVSAVAPPLTTGVSIGAVASNGNVDACWVDNFQWNYVTGVAASVLAYRATQAEAGISGVAEPVWPTVVGGTVVDNEVTWEAVETGTVTWEASSILTSGVSEPTWPQEEGAYVSDNTIAWKASSLRIADENCPHTKVVAIAASKVFAGDVDVVRFCATLNARDWTSSDDAGFLPSGLQQKGQVGVDAMGVYRGNLAVWSASTFQVWQVDPDPAAMALLDAMEGVGSTFQQAVQPVSNDLFFLAALGVRTVSISAGANNLATGDAGVPIDTLVQDEMYETDIEPVATYYPGAGQFWLAFRPLSIAAGLLAGQFLLTSTLYPYESIDALQTTSAPVSARMVSMPIEAVEHTTTPMSAEHAGGLLEHIITEAVEHTTTPIDALFGGGLVENTSTDAIVHGTEPVDMTIDEIDVFEYTHPDEAIITSGTYPKSGKTT